MSRDRNRSTRRVSRVHPQVDGEKSACHPSPCCPHSYLSERERKLEIKLLFVIPHITMEERPGKGNFNCEVQGVQCTSLKLEKPKMPRRCGNLMVLLLWQVTALVRYESLPLCLSLYFSLGWKYPTWRKTRKPYDGLRNSTPYRNSKRKNNPLVPPPHKHSTYSLVIANWLGYEGKLLATDIKGK